MATTKEAAAGVLPLRGTAKRARGRAGGWGKRRGAHPGVNGEVGKVGGHRTVAESPLRSSAADGEELMLATSPGAPRLDWKRYSTKSSAGVRLDMVARRVAAVGHDGARRCSPAGSGW